MIKNFTMDVIFFKNIFFSVKDTHLPEIHKEDSFETGGIRFYNYFSTSQISNTCTSKSIKK